MTSFVYTVGCVRTKVCGHLTQRAACKLLPIYRIMSVPWSVSWSVSWSVDRIAGLLPARGLRMGRAAPTEASLEAPTETAALFRSRQDNVHLFLRAERNGALRWKNLEK